MQCNRCGGDMKLIPAGTSKKTGKPYRAFWGCLDRSCGGTQPAIENPAQRNSGASRGIPDDGLMIALDRVAQALERIDETLEAYVGNSQMDKEEPITNEKPPF